MTPLYSLIRPLALLLLFCASLPSSFSQIRLKDSLLAHYPLNGNALDSSQYMYHGEAIGAIPVEDRFGNTNFAYHFDGIDDVIEIPSSPKLKASFPISISVWVKRDTIAPQGIFRNDYQEDIYTGIWLNLPKHGRVNLEYGDGGPAGPQSRRTKVGTTTIKPDQWYHIVGIIRGPLDMDIYVNGVNDCGSYEGSGGALMYSSSHPANIGRTDPSTILDPIYFEGAIDDLRFYNRELNVEEIAYLAQSPDSGPLLSINRDTTICIGSTANLSASGAIGYQWLAESSLSCVSCANPVASPDTTTTYYVAIATASICNTFLRDTLSTTVTVIDSTFSFLIDSINASSITVRMPSAYPFDVQWTFGDGSFFVSSGEIDSLSHIFTSTGTFEICGTPIDPNGFLANARNGRTPFCFSPYCLSYSFDPCDSAGLGAGFSINREGFVFSFQDSTSSRVDSIFWDFDNGFSRPSLPNEEVKIRFPEAGEFQVCMEVYKTFEGGAFCADTLCQTINTSLTSNTHTLPSSSWRLYPNPSQGNLLLELFNLGLGPLHIRVYDMQGKEVYQQGYPHSNQPSHSLPLSKLAKGSYVVQVQLGEKMGSKIFIIE